MILELNHLLDKDEQFAHPNYFAWFFGRYFAPLPAFVVPPLNRDALG
jgi:hypothetical protein